MQNSVLAPEGEGRDTRFTGDIRDTAGASEYTGLAVSTLEKLRVYGGGPRFVKFSRAVRYRVADLDAWLASRVVESTSERIAA